MNIYTVPFCEDILDLATRAILKEPELTRLAVILPNQRSKVYFRYRLLETAGKEALFLPKIFEMSEFQREIIQMRGGMILDNLGRSLLLRQAIKDTKAAMESGDVNQIKEKMEVLTKASHHLAEVMYKQAQPQQEETQPPPGDSGSAQAEKDEDVVDAEFEDAEKK